MPERWARRSTRVDDADHEHDRYLHHDSQAHRRGGKADAARRQPDGAGRQDEAQRLPGRVPRGVMGDGQRHHAPRHGEHPRYGHGEPHRDQDGRGDARPRSQRGLHVGDEASRRRLRLGEFGHDEGKQDDGQTSRENRQRRGNSSGDGDHPEGEVEVDPWPDVGDRRGRHVHRAQLPSLEMVSAHPTLAHRVNDIRRFPGAYGSRPALPHRAKSERTSISATRYRTGRWVSRDTHRGKRPGRKAHVGRARDAEVGPSAATSRLPTSPPAQLRACAQGEPRESVPLASAFAQARARRPGRRRSPRWRPTPGR